MKPGKLNVAFLQFIELPWPIRRKILAYYLHRISFTKAVNSQIIWTSFYYYTLRHPVQVVETSDSYKVSFYYNKKPLIVNLRKGDSSDVFVFFQVFIRDEYLPLFEKVSNLEIGPRYVIDAGANIGFFSLALSCHFPALKILAIEPDPDNYRMMNLNLEANGLIASSVSFRAALWVRRQKLFLQKKNSKEWSYAVSETKNGDGEECEATTIDDITQMEDFSKIDILKIDIEGAESALFQDLKFLNNLSRTLVLAIEIHDDKADRRQINNVFHDKGFQFMEQGELTIAWNMLNKII